MNNKIWLISVLLALFLMGLGLLLGIMKLQKEVDHLNAVTFESSRCPELAFNSD